MRNMDPTVSIVMVTWNGARDLELCLTSLKKLDYPNYDVTIVDNDVDMADPQFLRTLVRAMEEGDTTGACGPIVLDESRDTIQATGEWWM